MIGTRLRGAPTDHELAAMYPTPHDHTAYGAGHDLRVRTSIAIGSWLVDDSDAQVVADLSCGDGAIARTIAGRRSLILGDLAPGHPVAGRIEETLAALGPVGVYVCTETLEHLAEPLAVLRLIRDRAARLLVSFPHCDGADINTEHIWQWSTAEARSLLRATGWEPVTTVRLSVPDGPYSYTIAGCR